MTKTILADADKEIRVVQLEEMDSGESSKWEGDEVKVDDSDWDPSDEDDAKRFHYSIGGNIECS